MRKVLKVKLHNKFELSAMMKTNDTLIVFDSYEIVGTFKIKSNKLMGYNFDSGDLECVGEILNWGSDEEDFIDNAVEIPSHNID